MYSIAVILVLQIAGCFTNTLEFYKDGELQPVLHIPSKTKASSNTIRCVYTLPVGWVCTTVPLHLRSVWARSDIEGSEENSHFDRPVEKVQPVLKQRVRIISIERPNPKSTLEVPGPYELNKYWAKAYKKLPQKVQVLLQKISSMMMGENSMEIVSERGRGSNHGHDDRSSNNWGKLQNEAVSESTMVEDDGMKSRWKYIVGKGYGSSRGYGWGRYSGVNPAGDKVRYSKVSDIGSV